MWSLFVSSHDPSPFIFIMFLFYFPYLFPKSIYFVSLLLVEGMPTECLEPFSIMHSLWTGRLERVLWVFFFYCVWHSINWWIRRPLWMKRLTFLLIDTASDISSQLPTWCHLCAEPKFKVIRSSFFFSEITHITLTSILKSTKFKVN